MSVLVVRVGPDDVDACSDWLFQLGATAIEERIEDDDPVLVAGFGSDDAALAARSVLQERWACRLEDTGDEAAWRDEWLRHIEPVAVGSMLIHAPWHDVHDTLPDITRISIDPGRAFGSGHHPTTRLAIELLQQHVTSGDVVLDAGCGTGVLSVVAAQLGARAVTGIDLDHDILAVAQANLDANLVADRVTLSEAPIAELETTHDVVVANIVIGDLRPLLGHLVATTRRVAIITGFLVEQFESLLVDLPIRVVERRDREGWGAAVLAPLN